MEMKNICGKIPVDLHEKMKLEIEELGISIPKYLEMVIEEHMIRKGEKTNMADLRTVAVQVTEDLFSRLKAVLAKNGMKQKDFLIWLIEEAIEKRKPNGKQSQRKPKKQKENQQNQKWKILSQRKRILRSQNQMKSQQKRKLKQTEKRQNRTKLKQMKSRQSQKTKSQQKQSQQNWKPKKQKNLSQRKRDQKNRHHKTETKRRKRCREICTVFSQRREADSRNNSIF